MSQGSKQLRTFRICIRDGLPLEVAAECAGFSLTEAKLTIQADEADPPPPEAYELIGTPERKTSMGRKAKIKDDQVEEVGKHDYALAVRIYRQDIKREASAAATHNQSLGQAYKEIKKAAHIQPQAAKLAFKLDDMEEAKREDFLRSLNGLLKELNIYMPSDLIDQAEGKARNESVIPFRTGLATIPVSDGVDADLADGELMISGVDKAKADEDAAWEAAE